MAITPARDRALYRRIQFGIKRLADIVVAVLALLALTPLLLCMALLIRLDSPGPILFRQMREGLNGRLFEIWKFRTMFADCGDRSGVTQTVADDSRVTRIGRWLRRTDIDELPQLVNVLLGHMSFVGPRPHPLGMLAAGQPYQEVAPRYLERLAVRPGITGWAQCHGLRGPTERADLAIARLEHDLYYIQHFSLLLDAKIILRTALQEMRGGTGM